MRIIKSQDFLKDLYKYLVKQENQGVFVINFFNAAGCTYFVLPKLKCQRTTQYLENERHFTKDRSVQLIKDKFPSQINLVELSKYIESQLKDDKLRECMSHFGVPVSFDENKQDLSKALAYQFQLFVEADKENIDNEIALEYERLINGSQSGATVRRSTAYRGDDYWVEQSAPLNIACYQTATYTWVIHNAGTVHWQNRKLVLVNEDKNKPRPEEKVIPIPDVAPNGYAKIATNFEARSIEGRFTCEWEMQDSQGTACFGMNAELNVVINVLYGTDMEE